MLGDVPAARLHGVLTAEVAEPIDDLQHIHSGKISGFPGSSVDGVHVFDEPGDHRRDVVGIPEAIGVGLAHADVSIEGTAFEKGIIIPQHDPCGHRSTGLAEMADPAVRMFEPQSAAGHFLQQADDHPFRESAGGMGRRGAGDPFAFEFDGGIHGRFLFRLGWGRITSSCASSRSDFRKYGTL